MDDNYGDVLAELRRTVPENEGRWTASQAAAAYGETEQFEAETGLAGASAQVSDAGQAIADASNSPEGVSADQVAASLRAGADYTAGLVDADTTRNRYQQSTEFTPAYDPVEAKDNIAQGLQANLDLLQQDPRAMGAGTLDDQQAYSDEKEYAARTGDEAALAPGYQSAGLSPAQQTELAGMRESQNAQDVEQGEVKDFAFRTGDEAMQDPDYQSAGLSPDQQTQLEGMRQQDMDAAGAQWQEQQERLAASEQGALERRSRAEE